MLYTCDAGSSPVVGTIFLSMQKDLTYWLRYYRNVFLLAFLSVALAPLVLLNFVLKILAVFGLNFYEILTGKEWSGTID